MKIFKGLHNNQNTKLYNKQSKAIFQKLEGEEETKQNKIKKKKQTTNQPVECFVSGHEIIFLVIRKNKIYYLLIQEPACQHL